MAVKFWNDSTTTEPAKYRRPNKAVQDGEETVPTRYQTTTNEEAYLEFKESCQDEVASIMSKHSAELVGKYRNRPDSADKDYRLNYYREKLPHKFPGQSWFLEQRPPEVKMMHDHTTGLCKVSTVITALICNALYYTLSQACEAARLNFEEYVKGAKRNCRCGTKECPNWICQCSEDEDTGEMGPCTCQPCYCDVCSTCKVTY